MAKKVAKPETPPSLDNWRAIQILEGQREKGNALLAKHPLEKNEPEAWASTTREMLIRAFGSASHNVIDFSHAGAFRMASSPAGWEQVKAETLGERLSMLTGFIDQLKIIGGEDDTALSAATARVGTRIFIGHGGDPTWREVKDFVVDRLHLNYDEFNREATAGIPTAERLQKMLDESAFALIVMTGEDEHTDGKRHPRENVIHELGLFQGHLGFRRAIILLEEGCDEFSNIEGVTQIRFKKGQVSAKFEEIRRTLERECKELLKS